MGLNNFTGNSSNNSTSTPPTGGMPISFPPMGGGTVDANDYIINYNDKYKNAGPALFRDEIVQQTLAVLIGKNHPNALLVGSAGVGKTKIAEDIAYKLANNDPLIPDKLKGYTIYELPLSNIVAGSGIVGEIEEKLKAVIEFMTDKHNKAIMFIDEIHTLADDKSSTYSKIAQILKPALARTDMHVIGATTLQESNNLLDDPALSRRFSRLIVDELSREQTLEILKKAKHSFFTHYGNKVVVDDATLETVALLADEYKSAGSHRPDNAITLLDRAMGEAIVNRKAMEQKAANDPILLQAIQSVPIITLTDKQIKTTAIKLMTGCNKKENLNVDSLLDKLSIIKGQDEVVTTVVDMLRRNDMALFPKTKPLTFLFAGSTGVGKTEIANIIAEELTGMKPITLNMTEYHSSASINRIIGSPAGYIGSDSNAELPFDCLESNPYQVILLDEFEKCDMSVQRLFMSAFNDGYIKTAKGKTIDFSKAIIIATTNAGHKERKNTLGFTPAAAQTSVAANVDTLSKWFDIELLNRFKAILTFNDLTDDIYREIVVNKYHTEIARIRAERRRITLLDDIPDDDLDTIVKTTYVPAFGARPAEKAVQEYIENQV